MLTVPPGPTGTVARLATFSPVRKLTFEVDGRPAEPAYAVRKPGPSLPVAVRLRLTARVPTGRPGMTSVSGRAGSRRPAGAPRPDRVSSTRRKLPTRPEDDAVE